VSLGGTLSVKLINGFVPVIGDSFTILTGSAVSGQFATVKGLRVCHEISNSSFGKGRRPGKDCVIPISVE
jgi:hypothetical protein